MEFQDFKNRSAMSKKDTCRSFRKLISAYILKVSKLEGIEYMGYTK